MSRRMLGRLGLVLLATAVLGTLRIAIPGIAFGCSCVSQDELIELARTEPRTMVFSGEVGLPAAGGVPVTLTRWFKGEAPAPVVFLDVDGVMESSCGTTAPPAGTEVLFASWVSDEGRLTHSLCSLAADLSTDEGRARLAQAEAAFGRAPPLAFPEPVAPPTDGPALPGESTTSAAVPAGVLAIAGGAALLLVLGVGLVLAARRRAP